MSESRKHQVRIGWAWESLGCTCGAEGLDDDVALTTHLRAETLLSAARHFEEFDEVTIGATDIGSNLIPLSPAERLRRMAEEG